MEKQTAMSVAFSSKINRGLLSLAKVSQTLRPHMVAAWHFDLSSHAEQSFYCCGADDGRVVLNLMTISRIRLYLASIFRSVSVSLKYIPFRQH